MDNRQQYANYDYSTLEVTQQSQSPLHQGQDKYPAHVPHNAPEVVNSSSPEVVNSSSPEVVDSLHLPEVTQKQEYLHIAAPYSLDPYSSPASLHAQEPVQGRRIWGMRRKTFFVLLGLLLAVVIAAAVGGAVGASARKKKNGKDTSGTAANPTTPTPSANTTSSTPDAQSAILTNSKIAAVNWTDDNAIAYHGIFWQAKDDSLMVSIRNSQNNSWTINNITGSLSSENQLVAKSGTPLAAAALGAPWTLPPFNKQNGLVLFFLSPRNVLQSLAADLPGKSWRLGNLSKSGQNLETAEDTQLSIWWALCSTNCSSNINIWYETKDQTLMQGNGKDNWSHEPNALLGNISPGGAIAAAAVAPLWGLNGTDAWSPRLYYDQSGSISELLHNDDVAADDAWAYGQTLAQKVGDPSPRIAALGYYLASAPKAGDVGILLGMNTANGSMIVNYWNNETWHGNDAPTMMGKQYANFTSIGMFQAEDIMFYGLTNESEIHSYKVDRWDPLSWTYGEMVGTS